MAAQPSLNGTTILEDATNRSLGSLNHHDRAITRLHFPTKGKLFSAAEDNVVAISRTRDWTMLSSIKAPIPKAHGRPSGDTAAPGEVSTGVNDFAIHPSQKLMLSVSRGERCMRLWNLMTGKKAGVLNFDRELTALVGATKFSSGEGRRVLWDAHGERFIVGFERGAVSFGMDSKPLAVVRPTPQTKLHQYQVVSSTQNNKMTEVLALSTEDGRILLYDLSSDSQPMSKQLPGLKCLGQIGGRLQGVTSRLKDFRILPLTQPTSSFLVVGGGSDGTIWLWLVNAEDVEVEAAAAEDASSRQIGRLLGQHKTESRITCLDAFVMDREPDLQQMDILAVTSDQEDSS